MFRYIHIIMKAASYIVLIKYMQWNPALGQKYLAFV